MLGVARIVPKALIQPAKDLDGVEVASIASRDVSRAEQFAAEHGIASVHSNYAELLRDDSLDAIYVPLPVSLHAEWAIAALEAGHHVLCEKPFASNAYQARLMVAAAERAGKRLVEALHSALSSSCAAHDRVIATDRSICGRGESL